MQIIQKNNTVTFTVFLQNIIGEIQSFQQKFTLSGVLREGEKLPMQILLIFKLVTWIRRADQQKPAWH